jgi:hypothetical protein
MYMRRLFLAAALSFVCMSHVFAGDTETFMIDFKAFVASVENTQDDDLGQDSLATIEVKYDEFLKAYINEYKSQMSNAQLSDFAKYRARFKKKTLRVKGKRGMSKVAGWIEGVVGQ